MSALWEDSQLRADPPMAVGKLTGTSRPTTIVLADGSKWGHQTHKTLKVIRGLFTAAAVKATYPPPTPYIADIFTVGSANSV